MLISSYSKVIYKSTLNKAKRSPKLTALCNWVFRIFAKDTFVIGLFFTNECISFNLHHVRKFIQAWFTIFKCFLNISKEMGAIPFKSSPPEVFLGKGVLKTCSKFRENPCRSAISAKLLCNFIEMALRHGCSPVNLLHIFRTPFPKNTSGGLLLSLRNFWKIYFVFQ